MNIKKPILSAALILAAISTFTSCIIEESGYRPKPTLAGVVIYNNTNSNISSVLEIADLAIKLDLYLTSPESEKAGISAKYLPNYGMTQSSGLWTIRPANNVYVIKPDSKSLHTVGAKWEARAENPAYAYESQITPLFVVIECTGEKAWKVTVSEKPGYNDNFAADYTITGSTSGALYPNSLYEYTVSGSGNYMPYGVDFIRDFLSVQYSIKTPLKFVPRFTGNYSNIIPQYIAVKGKIELFVSDDVLSSRIDHIVVELISQTSYGVNKIVTFNGVTETWSDNGITTTWPD
ncbi:MAG: hypothetical protein HGA83_02840 [Bacteroidales bacterium]|nr:hypothetical protein [Bacteroidales bacterium]